ncbi:MAG: type II toxin-antitoxin system VapC family toxin [Oceanipulchritudo sp.]
MNRVVADASFCGAWILPDESSEAAAALLEEIESGAVELVVPALWHYEMGNLLKSAIRRGRLTRAAARSAQDLLGQVPLGLCDVPSAQTGRAILELSLKHGLSAYDSSYLELARRLKLPLRTADKPLRKAAAAELDMVADQ